jgi:hypothetical protein
MRKSAHTAHVSRDRPSPVALGNANPVSLGQLEWLLFEGAGKQDIFDQCPKEGYAAGIRIPVVRLGILVNTSDGIFIKD